MCPPRRIHGWSEINKKRRMVSDNRHFLVILHPSCFSRLFRQILIKSGRECNREDDAIIRWKPADWICMEDFVSFNRGFRPRGSVWSQGRRRPAILRDQCREQDKKPWLTYPTVLTSNLETWRGENYGTMQRHSISWIMRELGVKIQREPEPFAFASEQSKYTNSA